MFNSHHSFSFVIVIIAVEKKIQFIASKASLQLQEWNMFNTERGLLGIFLLDVNLVSLSFLWLKQTNKQKALQKQLAGEMVYSDSKFPLEFWHSPFERGGITTESWDKLVTLHPQSRSRSRSRERAGRRAGLWKPQGLLPVTHFFQWVASSESFPDSATCWGALRDIPSQSLQFFVYSSGMLSSVVASSL